MYQTYQSSPVFLYVYIYVCNQIKHIYVIKKLCFIVMKKTKLLFEQLYIYTLLINKIYNSILIINLIIFY